MEDIRRRDSFLKLLRQRKLDLASEARCALRRAWWRRRAPELEKAAQRREQRLAAGLDAGGPGGEEEEVAVDPDDFPAQCEKEIDSGRIALTFAEFRRLLDREAVVMAEAEIAHVMRILDSGVTSGQELSALRRRQRADADSEEKSDGAPAQGAAATGGGGDIGSLRRSVRAARADKRISYAEITRFLDNPPVSSLEQWSDARRDHGVAYLRDLARPELKRRAEERKLKMGDPPETPVVERVDAGEEGDDPCTTLRLAWRVPAHSAPVAFFVVETCGAEVRAPRRPGGGVPSLPPDPSLSPLAGLCPAAGTGVLGGHARPAVPRRRGRAAGQAPAHIATAKHILHVPRPRLQRVRRLPLHQRGAHHGAGPLLPG